MKSPVKNQRGNAFHRGWPQAKESYLNSSPLEVQLFLEVHRSSWRCNSSSLEVHRSQESFRTRSNDLPSSH